MSVPQLALDSKDKLKQVTETMLVMYKLTLQILPGMTEFSLGRSENTILMLLSSSSWY